MHSPYKHMTGREVQRLDLILLDGLSRCADAASTDAVMHISDPRGFAELDTEKTVHELTLLLAEGYVERIDGQRMVLGFPVADRLRWQITAKGRAHLVASETRAIIEDVARHTPAARPRKESAPPKPITDMLREAHAQLDTAGVPKATVCNAAEPKIPAVATIHVDEDELDDWWSSLDVNHKAAAFCEYSLTESGPHASPTQLEIPFAGTVGELKPMTATALKQAAEAMHASVTGGA